MWALVCSDYDIADIVLQIVDRRVVGGEASLSLGHLGSVAARTGDTGGGEQRQPDRLEAGQKAASTPSDTTEDTGPESRVQPDIWSGAPQEHVLNSALQWKNWLDRTTRETCCINKTINKERMWRVRLNNQSLCSDKTWSWSEVLWEMAGKSDDIS